MSDQKFREDGQASVELALALPIVALILMLLLQAGVIARDSILLSSATREAARSLAVENSNDLALTKARNNLSDVTLDISRPNEVGSTLTVTGKKNTKVHLLFIPAFNLELKETISMRVEK